MEFRWENFCIYTKCKKCGSEAIVDGSVVYTSLPPMYQYKCPKCGYVGYVGCSETGTEILNDGKNL